MKNENSKLSKVKLSLLVVFGLVIGFLSGFFGGGGGMLLVPVLISIANYTQKQAHATAQSIILPLTIVSAVVYLIFGGYDFSVGLPVGIAFIVGGIVGSLLLKKIPNLLLGILFSVLMIVGGVKLLW